MKLIKKQLGIACTLVTGVLLCGIACAAPVTMNFDGMGTNEQVANYYNGGCSTFFGSPATCGGPNYGVMWSGAQTSDVTSSSSGTLSPPSSPNYIILTNPDGLFQSATMNVAAGFGTGLAFYYYGSPMVAVYSGPNGTGTLLNPGSAMLDLATCGSLGFCSHGLGFSGSAMSVIFSGNGIFDNVTLGRASAVPEPAEFGMFGLGVLLIGLFAGLRRRKA